MFVKKLKHAFARVLILVSRILDSLVVYLYMEKKHPKIFAPNTIIRDRDYNSGEPATTTKGLRSNEKLAFDVGAYIGNSIPRIRSLGFPKIVCFEPDPINFSKLLRNYYDDENVIFVNKAVSNRSDQKLILFKNRELPWLNTLSESWIVNTRHRKFVRKLKKIAVESVSLDDFMRQTGEIPGYIKIDVEGHELEVLEGLHQKPLLLSFEWISELFEKNIECIQKASERGFTEFYICFEETVPGPLHKPLTLESAIIEMENLKRCDTENNLGGNVWCK